MPQATYREQKRKAMINEKNREYKGSAPVGVQLSVGVHKRPPTRPQQAVQPCTVPPQQPQRVALRPVCYKRRNVQVTDDHHAAAGIQKRMQPQTECLVVVASMRGCP